MAVQVHKIVTDFSKKTGDYQSLSAVDLRLIALTYQLEKERGPQRGTNLRTDPIQTHKEQQIVVIAMTGFNAFFALKMWRTKKEKRKAVFII
uniref:Ribonuclease PIN domain-containing protein n=1 Tax=Amphimedon queenslandica TaxID=400682 RepID=A0A1X7U582_AMPQE